MKRRISRRFRPTMTPGLDQLESRQLLSSGFQVVSSPTIAASGLNAVSAVSPTDIWAVGDQGSGPTTLAENFNGTTWSKVATPNPAGATSAELNGVSALSSSAVWAVGESSSGPLVEFFNGKSWSIQASPTIAGGGGTLNAVDALSATDVWAVGNTGTGESRDQLIENFNGTSWSVVQAPSAHGALTGISAVSSTDIFAVGGGTKDVPNQLVQFNGTTWSVVPNGPADADAVDAISATDVWAAGGSGLWNFNGATWSQVAFSNGNSANDFSAISGTSANNIFAVGSGFSSSNGLATGFGTAASQWNGTSWSTVTTVNPSSNQDAFTGAATFGNGTVVAVGNEIPGTGFIQSATFTVTPPANPIATTTALTAAPGSTSFGAPVTLTATITPASTGSAAPTGAVDFFSGSTLLGNGTVSNDVATLTTTALPVGTNSITAEYLGDPNYAASTSKAVSVTITQATTTTAVSFSPAEPVLGQSATLTATLTPAATGPASPTGTVEFFDGSTLLGSGTVSNDAATLATTALPLGTSTITAEYLGDTNYVASTSSAESVTVVQSGSPASGSFQVVTSPTVTRSGLNAVSAVSATDIWAVGSQNASNDDVAPLTENFNGTSWSVVAAPTPAGASGAEFTGVSAVASNNVWAVGESFSTQRRQRREREYAAGRALQRHILEHPDDAGDRRQAQCGDRRLGHRRLGRGRHGLRRPHRELQWHDLEHRPGPITAHLRSVLERDLGGLEHRHLRRRRRRERQFPASPAIQRYDVELARESSDRHRRRRHRRDLRHRRLDRRQRRHLEFQRDELVRGLLRGWRSGGHLGLLGQRHLRRRRDHLHRG